ncbi:hypothetical protein ON010_g15154 [Phytophthora cinnamomi]|nr:hypothetical protein ON010_g15154 [Phytophthora cinnamomi]
MLKRLGVVATTTCSTSVGRRLLERQYKYWGRFAIYNNSTECCEFSEQICVLAAIIQYGSQDARVLNLAEPAPIRQEGALLRSAGHLPTASPTRHITRKQGASTPASAQNKRTPKKTRTSTRRCIQRTPPPARNAEDGMIPLSVALSVADAAELRIVLDLMFKKRKPTGCSSALSVQRNP